MLNSVTIEAQLIEWRRQYGENGSIPLHLVEGLLSNSVIDYVRSRYLYNPMLDALVSRTTGLVQDTPVISCGGNRSPISQRRAEWYVRVGTDPHRVGKDMRGLWSKEEGSNEKVYAK